MDPMAITMGSLCDYCGMDLEPWQIAFSSECSHTLHLLCACDVTACPVRACKARWNDTLAISCSPAPVKGDRPLYFLVPPQPFVSPEVEESLFPSEVRKKILNSVFGPTPTPYTPHSCVYPGLGAKPFEWELPAPPPPPPPPPPAGQPPSCAVCDGDIVRGQAAVRPDCKHMFHLRCISGFLCPLCCALWQHVVTVTPAPPPVDTSCSQQRATTVQLPGSARKGRWRRRPRVEQSATTVQPLVSARK